MCCPVCGKLAEALCPECLEQASGGALPRTLECGTRVRGVSPYDACNRKIIHAMKYRGERAIAWMLGAEIAKRLERPDVDVLVPVPLHKGSRRWYNQAELIASAAGRAWGIDVRSLLVWNKDVERRALQKNKERSLPRCAIMSRGRDLGGTRVCIVDDVCTSGGTISAASEAVREAGGVVGEAIVWSIV